MKRRVWCLWLLFPVLWACGDEPTTTIEDIEQQYLFEVEQVNMAWLFHWVGLVVERDGNVYAFDHSHAVWDRTSSAMFTENELREKYAFGRRLIGHIDDDVLVRQFDRIRDVGIDFWWSDPLCHDTGVLAYRAWRYDPSSRAYMPLVLREEGDNPRRNTSPAAEALSEWLRELIPTLDNPAVTPFDEGFCTP
jgi:hypothetical protein